MISSKAEQEKLEISILLASQYFKSEKGPFE
jgi:hypothetical protein